MKIEIFLVSTYFFINTDNTKLMLSNNNNENSLTKREGKGKEEERKGREKEERGEEIQFLEFEGFIVRACGWNNHKRIKDDIK